MIYVIGKDFTGYEVGALWDDGVFGVKHWRAFSGAALRGDQGWLRRFKPFSPCAVRRFGLADLPPRSG
jgi:hypothetical protein